MRRAPRLDSVCHSEQNRNRSVAPALLMLLVAFGLGACSSGGRAPPGCEGTMRQLNPGRWQATPNGLVEPPPGRTACLPAAPSVAIAVPALAGGSVS